MKLILKWLLLALAIVLAACAAVATLLGIPFAIAYHAETAPVSAEDKIFAQDLVKVGTAGTSLAAIHTDPWETVCQYGGYETIAATLGTTGTGRGISGDRSSEIFTMESEMALAFFNAAGRRTRAVVMKRMHEFGEIRGPQCVARANAFVSVRQATYADLKFNILVLGSEGGR